MHLLAVQCSPVFLIMVPACHHGFPSHAVRTPSSLALTHAGLIAGIVHARGGRGTLSPTLGICRLGPSKPSCSALSCSSCRFLRWAPFSFCRWPGKGAQLCHCQPWKTLIMFPRPRRKKKHCKKQYNGTDNFRAMESLSCFLQVGWLAANERRKRCTFALCLSLPY